MTKKLKLTLGQERCFGSYVSGLCGEANKTAPPCTVAKECRAASRSTGAREHVRTRVRGGRT